MDDCIIWWLTHMQSFIPPPLVSLSSWAINDARASGSGNGFYGRAIYWPWHGGNLCQRLKESSASILHARGCIFCANLSFKLVLRSFKLGKVIQGCGIVIGSLLQSAFLTNYELLEYSVVFWNRGDLIC